VLPNLDTLVAIGLDIFEFTSPLNGRPVTSRRLAFIIGARFVFPEQSPALMILDAFLLSLIQALSNTPLYLGERILHGLADLFGGIILLVIGVLVIVFVVAAVIVMLPAIILGFLVWLVTGSFFYAGIAFLVVALISIFAMAGD
jgi:hypothetical protein